MTPTQLQIDSTGWVRGVTHHVSPNYSSGMAVPSGVMGVIMHTMVGNLTGVDAEFMNRNSQVSAHFGIGQDGKIIQWVDTIGGNVAWAEMGGNYNWYSIEHADNGDPRIPLTPEQMNSSAQLVELLSRVGNFPLQVSDSALQEGYGVHYMGGSAWGGHTCPDVPPMPVRSLQRPAILAIAREIRTPSSFKTWITKGMLTLSALAAQLGYQASTLLRVTLGDSGQQSFAPVLAQHVNTVFAGDAGIIPPGCWFFVPGHGPWATGGLASLNDVAGQNGSTPAAVLVATIHNAPGHLFPGRTSNYINSVFARTRIHCPAGVYLHY